MQLIKIGNKVINLQNVKFVELSKNSSEREIRFYFVDGSLSYCRLGADEIDIEFDAVWRYFTNLEVIS
ncbi:MAG: hypothetical protein JHC30_06260 [Caldisericum sp.]|jgi:hypothetical protein|nr:hypothetical protein [Caldisericum sp.]